MTLVTKRVWTTERSSAKERSIVPSQAAATGLAGSPTIASFATPAGTSSRAESNSLVRPEREIAMTRA